MGAQVVTKPQNALWLAIIGLEMVTGMPKEEVCNKSNIRDRCITIILQKLLEMASTKLAEY